MNLDLYKKYLRGKHWDNHSTAYAEKFAAYLKSVNFASLLVDLGCGSGRDVNVFYSDGFDVVGVDHDDGEIRNASSKFPDCVFRVENIEDLTFEDDSIGAFFIINVIHYVDQQKALSEVRRTLKNDGLVYIHFNLDVRSNHNTLDYHQNEDAIRDLLSDFSIVEENKTERIDLEPFKHTHKILELILRKH